jgi:hypothetical protein
VTPNFEETTGKEIKRLRNLFSLPNGIQNLDEPATVVDLFGKILLWYLPGILSRKRVVRLCFLK